MSVEIKVTSDSRQANADLSRLEKSLGDIGTKASETSKKLNFKVLADNSDAKKKLLELNKSLGSLFSKDKNKVVVSSDTASAERGVKTLRQEIDKTTSAAKLLSNTLATLTTFGLGAGALKVASDFEVLNTRLVTLTGSVEDAQQAFSELEKFVKTTPYSLRSLTDAYARLTATGSDTFKTQKDVLSAIDALADSVAAVGGSSYNFTQVAIAFERMSTEGRITAERLNQLAEAGIPLTRIADKLGMSMSELRAESEAGTFSFKKFYDAFKLVAKGADGFGGAAAAQANTLAGATSNLSDSIQMLFDKILRTSGITGRLVERLKSTDNAVNSIGDGIDYKIANKLAKLDGFMLDLSMSMFKLKWLFIDFKDKVVSLFDFNLDPATNKFGNFISAVKRQFSDFPTFSFDGLFKTLNILNNKLTDWKPKPINLKEYLPSLDKIMQVVAAFGEFVKGVFYDIWDAVVGHSYWPDTIEGIVEWAGELRVAAGKKIKEFANFVLDTFVNLRDYLTLKLSIIVDNPTIRRWLDAFKSVGKVVSDNVLTAANDALRFLTNSEGTISITPVIKTAKSFSEFFKNLKESVKNISLAPVIDSIRNVLKKLKLDEIAEVVTSAMEKGVSAITNKGFWTSAFDAVIVLMLAKFNAGFRSVALLAAGIKLAVYLQDLLVTDAFTKAVEAAGEFVGRTVREVFTSNAEQGIIDLLFKITKVISNFGKSILKGAGIPEFANSDGGGLIVGLIATTLATAVLTNRIGKLVSYVWKTLTYFFRTNDNAGIGRQIGEKIATGALAGFGSVFSQLGTAITASLSGIFSGSAAGAGAAWAAFGGTLAGYLKSGFTLAFKAGGGLAGAFVGSFLAKEVIKLAGIESEVSKLATEVGIILSTSLVASVVAQNIGAKIAAVVFSSAAWSSLAAGVFPLLRNVLIAGAISLGGLMATGINTAFGLGLIKIAAAIVGFVAGIPALLVGAVALLGGGILYLLLGDEEGLAGKVRKMLKGWFEQFKQWAKDIGQEVSKYIPDFFKRSGKGTTDENRGYISEFSGQAYATGGNVRGAGTGTSDSILARLSNGEFVVNARDAAKNRGLLERINNGLPAFEQGGAVDLLKGKFLARFSTLKDKLYKIFKPIGNVIDPIEKEVQKLPEIPALPGVTESLYTKYINIAKEQELGLISTLNGLNSYWQSDFELLNSKNQKFKGARPIRVERSNADLMGRDYRFEPAEPAVFLPNLDPSDDKLQDGNNLKRAYSVMLHELGHMFDFAFDMSNVTALARPLADSKGIPHLSNEYFSLIYSLLDSNNYSEKWGRTNGESLREINANIWASRQGLLPSEFEVGTALRDGFIESYLKKDIGDGSINVLFNNLQLEHLDYLDDGRLNSSIDQNTFTKIRRDKDIASLKSIAGFATGGSISGPGTGTSDSILARLSNGEFVVNAKATAKNRGLLESINNGSLPKFAEGGVVGRKTLVNDPRLIYRDTALLEAALKMENASEELRILTKAILAQESGGNINAPTSINGAVGAMQILPKTFEKVADAGWKITDPLDNMRAGIRYLSEGLRAADGDVRGAAAYYYSGPGGLNKMKAGVEVRNTLRPSDPTQIEYANQVANRISGGDLSLLQDQAVLFTSKLESLNTTSFGLDKGLRQLTFVANNTEATLASGFNAPTGSKLKLPTMYADPTSLVSSTRNLLDEKYQPKLYRGTTKESLLASSTFKFKDVVDFKQIADLDTFEDNLKQAGEFTDKISKIFLEYNRSGRLDVDSLKEAYQALNNIQKVINKQALEGVSALEQAKRTGERSDFSKGIGSQSSKGFREGFQGMLSTVLSGTNEQSFGSMIKDAISGRVIDSFSAGVTESLFGKEGGLGAMFTNIFGSQAEGGLKGGGLLGGLLKPGADFISGLFGAKPAEATATAVSTPLGSALAAFPQGSLLTGAPDGTALNPLYVTTGNGSIMGGKEGGGENIFGGIFDKLKGGLSDLMGSVTSMFSKFDFSSILSIFGFASGGRVSGKGSSTSDSIPAMLSNGEFIINAKSTSKYLPLLESINNGALPKFATGGLVTNAVTAPSQMDLTKDVTDSKSSSSQQVFNINVTGDISRQTKAEIMQMLPQIAGGVNSYNRENNIRR